MSNKPTCFISYCHDDVDEPAVDFFQQEIEKISNESINIIRDKGNIGAGDFINQHEKKLLSCEIIIVLFTPAYLKKIQNRTPSGVFREYEIIYSRHLKEQETLRYSNHESSFIFIPILFSGKFETAIPDQMKERMILNFTGFLTHRDKNGISILSTAVRRKFDDEFEKISAKFESSLDFKKKEYETEYRNNLRVLFLETKAELLSKRYHLAKQGEILNPLFVKTMAYEQIVSQFKCILIGRKGSGKSTIAKIFENNSFSKYKSSISIHVDNFDLGFIYNTIYTRKYSTEIGDIVNLEKFFNIVWKVFCYRAGATILIEDYESGTNIVNIEKWIPKIHEIHRINKCKYRDTFIDTCVDVANYINNTITREPANEKFLSNLAEKLSFEEIIKNVIGADRLNSMSKAIELCERRFVLILDGFDSNFDDFRNTTISNSTASAEEIQSRNWFEICWLKGMLRTILDLRSADEVYQDKIDFCVTIPQDRYLEARETERDDYRLRDLAADIHWSGYELAILGWKRLEKLQNLSSDKSNPPIERFNEMLSSPNLQIPESITLKVAGETIRISTFKYILRHTFWRPRDFLHILAAILTKYQFVKKRRRKITPAILREVVSRATYRIIDSEFFKEYSKNIVNIKQTVEKFEGSSTLIKFEIISQRLHNFDIFTSGGNRKISDIFEKIDLLYEIGFLGVYVGSEMKKRGVKCKELFNFSDGDEFYLAMGQSERKRSTYVIHPVFVEYLLLDADINNMVCRYSDDYLEENDTLRQP